MIHKEIFISNINKIRARLLHICRKAAFDQPNGVLKGLDRLALKAVNGPALLNKKETEPPSLPYSTGKCAERYKVNLKQFVKVDWNQRDIDIAKQLGVSRERVRQLRNDFKKHKSKYHKQGIRTIAILNTPRRQLEGKTIKELQALFPGACQQTIKVNLAKLGIPIKFIKPQKSLLNL
jgi:hypothetical protein